MVHSRTFENLLIELRLDPYGVVVLEDAPNLLPEWIGSLHALVGAMAPIVVYGVGDATRVAQSRMIGADDYVLESDGPDGLLLRVEAQLYLKYMRRGEAKVEVGNFELEEASRVLRMQEREANLTQREFLLARVLFENAGRVVTLQAISRQVWKRPADVGKRSIEQHVYRLRTKFDQLCEGQSERLRLNTVYGIGYKLLIESKAPAAAF